MATTLPPSLDLSPHLSAHKYFFVCTLTVAAWDTLVLSPRAWKLARQEGVPPLKFLFHFLQWFMPLEFVAVAVAFFDTNFSQNSCSHFYLFEPICTAILLAAASAVHVIRIHAIYDKNRAVLFGLGALFAIQVVVTGIACGFYRYVPLLEGQGCIAGPKSAWVGIYWVMPTVLYTVSTVLAIHRSLRSLQARPISYWKLMLRDGLNLYLAIWIVNMVNMFFWFLCKPTGTDDTIRTIVTSMAAVLTTSMTMRIVLSVRGSLVNGGSFAGSTSQSTGNSGLSRSGVVSTGRTGNLAPTFDLSQVSKGAEGGDWHLSDGDGKSSVNGSESKGIIMPTGAHVVGDEGVKITIDREIEYDS